MWVFARNFRKNFFQKFSAFEEKRRKSGKYGGGDDYQSLAGLDGDMFVKGRAYKRVDSPARVRREVWWLSEKIKIIFNFLESCGES